MGQCSIESCVVPGGVRTNVLSVVCHVPQSSNFSTNIMVPSKAEVSPKIKQSLELRQSQYVILHQYRSRDTELEQTKSTSEEHHTTTKELEPTFHNICSLPH